MSQKRQVLDYIRENGSITPKEAEDELGVMRLAARVYELIKDGFPIISAMEEGINRHGDTVRYARYTLSA